MFGYILINPKTLSKDEKARYRAAYCGLCGQLRPFGAAGRATLSYDMTFVALLLNSVYRLDERAGMENCFMRPAPRHAYFNSDAFAYAADMNILLAYYDELDDWHDERDTRALSRVKRLEPHLGGIAKRWPRQAARVEECVGRLTAMERENVLNPDEPANCFGTLMGELLDWRGDHAGLRGMGEALGRYLYLLDASNDLRADIKKERYNPLVAQLSADFEPMLTVLIGECTTEFEKICPERDLHLLRNVLYSGVWMRYRKESARRKGTADE